MARTHDYVQLTDENVHLYMTPAKFWVAVSGDTNDVTLHRRNSVNEYTPSTVCRDDNDNLYFIIRGKGAFVLPKSEYIHIDGDVNINLSAMNKAQYDAYNIYCNFFIECDWIEDYAKRIGMTPMEAARDTIEFRKRLYGSGRGAMGAYSGNAIIGRYDTGNNVVLDDPDEPLIPRFETVINL